MKRTPIFALSIFLAAAGISYWGINREPLGSSKPSVVRMKETLEPVSSPPPVATELQRVDSPVVVKDPQVPTIVKVEAVPVKREVAVASVSVSVPIFEIPVSPPVQQLAPAVVEQSTIVAPNPTEPEPEVSQTNDEFEGYAALELAQSMEGMERIQMVREGISRLLNFDVDVAVDAANSLENSHDHGVAVGSLLRQVAARDEVAAADILFTRVPPETAKSLMEYPRTAPLMKDLVMVQKQVNPEVAQRWVESFTGVTITNNIPYQDRSEMIKVYEAIMTRNREAGSSSSTSTGWSNSLPSGGRGGR